MRRRCLPARVNVRLLLILLATVIALGAAALAARYIRNQIILSRSLASGLAAYAQQDWAGTSKAFYEYLSRNPDNTEILEKYARASLLVRPIGVPNILAAADAYRRLLRLNPNHEQARGHLAILYAYTGQFGDLAQMAGKWADQAPDDPKAALWLAVALVGQGKPEMLAQARAVLDNPKPSAEKPVGLVQKLQTLAEKRPEFIEACALLGEIEVQIAGGSRDKALAWFDRAAEYDPGSPRARVYRAALLRRTPASQTETTEQKWDRLDAARKDLLEGDRLGTPDPRVRLMLAREWVALSSEFAAMGPDLRERARALLAEAKELRSRRDDKKAKEAEGKAQKAALKADQAKHDADEAAEHVAGELKALDAIKARLGSRRQPSATQEGEAPLLEYEVVDPQDLEVARFLLSAQLVLRRGAKPDDVAEAARMLREVLLDPAHRIPVLPATIEICATGGDPKEARSLLKEYLDAVQARRPPESRERIAYLQAVVAMAERDCNQVIDLLAPMVSAESPRPFMPSFLSLLVEAYSQTGQTQLANQARAQYLRMRPADPKMKLSMAREYGAQGDWAAALETARAAEAADRENLSARLLRLEAELHVAADQAAGLRKVRLDTLSEELSRLRKDYADRADIRILQAMIADFQGRADEAENELKLAIKECPDSLGPEILLARFYTRMQRTADATAVCRAACERHAKQAAPWILLSDLQAQSKQYDDARDTLQEGLKVAEGRDAKGDLQLKLALLEIARDNRAACIEQLKDQARRDNSDARSRLLLLEIPEIRGDENSAQQLIDQIRRIQGEGSLLWRLHQARLWLSQRQWRDKQKDIADALARCIGADRKWPEPARLLGAMYERLDDLDRAEVIYRSALSTNPAAADIADRLASLLERRGRFADAKQVLSQSAKGSSTFSGARWRLAVSEGNLAQYIEELRVRAARDPKDVDSRVSMARAAYAQRDVNLALKYLSEAEAIAAQSLAPTALKVAILEREGGRLEALRVLDAKVKETGSFAAYLMRAGFLASIGETALAEKDYIRLTTFPMNGAGHFRLSRFYSDSGKPDSAIAALEDGIKAYPANLALTDSLMRLLFDRGRVEDNKRANQLLAELGKSQPNSPGVLGVQALLKLREGTPESIREAQQLLERVVRTAPMTLDAHLMLITLAMRGRDYFAAKDLAIRAIDANPNRRELILARAEAESRLANFDVARDLARQALALNRDDIEALSLLTSLAAESRDARAINESKALLGDALKSRPDDARLQLANARLLDAMGQTKDAIAALEAYRQIEAGSRSVTAILALAELYRVGGDLTKSAERLQEAAKIAPDHPGVIQQQLLGLAAQKKFNEIDAAMSAYRAKKSPDPYVLLTAANVLRTSESRTHHSSAMALYEEVVRIAPQVTEARLGLARLSYESGDADRAERIYREVLASNPNIPEALNDLAWIVAEVRHDYKTALELADRGVSLAPGDDHLRDTRGVILLNLPGRIADACKDFEKFVELTAPDSPRRAKALLQLGRSRAKVGDFVAAKRHLEEALQIDRGKNVLSPQERAQINEILSACARQR